MKTATKPVLVGKRVSDAKLAYFEGDFGRCLDLCSEIYLRTAETASEVSLLKARAHLRMGQAPEAEAAIVSTLEVHSTVDAALTAQMLVGSARIRQSDADGGIAILIKAAENSGKAHFAVRSEIALCTALGYWAKRDIDTAENYLALVDPRSDIIHARALELHAWCFTVRRDFRRSADMFKATLFRLDRCKASDQVIAATALSTLAIFAAELFDRDLAHFVQARAQNMEWPSGLTGHRFTMLLHQALFNEFAGKTVEAYEAATVACEIAPSLAFEVFGLAISSTIASNAKEAHIATAFANKAQFLLNSIEARDLVGEERFSILCLAESFASIDSDKAAELFATYWRLAPADQMLVLAGDPRLVAEETLVEGVIAHAQLDRARAVTCYRKAFEQFRDIGYTRRAAIAAHALIKLTTDESPRMWLSQQLSGTNNFLSQSLADSSSRLIQRIESHPIVLSLSPAQQAIVVLLCLGKTNKQIAKLRHMSDQTVRNMLTTILFPLFGVSCRTELVSTCLRELLVG